jgi:hypothetical protein
MEHDPESIIERLERLEQSLRSRSSFTSPQTRINTPGFSREYLHGLFDDGLKSSKSHAPTSVASKKSIDASRKQSEYIDRVKDPIAISPMPMSPISRRSSKLAEQLCIESFTHRLVAGDRFNNLRWTGPELKDLLKSSLADYMKKPHFQVYGNFRRRCIVIASKFKSTKMCSQIFLDC